MNDDINLFFLQLKSNNIDHELLLKKFKEKFEQKSSGQTKSQNKTVFKKILKSLLSNKEYENYLDNLFPHYQIEDNENDIDYNKLLDDFKEYEMTSYKNDPDIEQNQLKYKRAEFDSEKQKVKEVDDNIKLDEIAQFYVSISGEIESVNIDINDCFIRYNFKAGVDWDRTCGEENGTTQYSHKYSNVLPLVYAHPFNISYKSCNPIGWPKIQFELIGREGWRTKNEVHKGYGIINIPYASGRHTEETRLFVSVNPISFKSVMDKISQQINPIHQDETKNYEKEKSANKVQSIGSIKVTFNITKRKMNVFDQVYQ